MKFDFKWAGCFTLGTSLLFVIAVVLATFVNFGYLPTQTYWFMLRFALSVSFVAFILGGIGGGLANE